MELSTSLIPPVVLLLSGAGRPYLKQQLPLDEAQQLQSSQGAELFPLPVCLPILVYYYLASVVLGEWLLRSRKVYA